MASERSQSFGFLLDGHEPVFHQLALGAEQVFAFDPNATVVKVRQLAEAFAKHAAAACGLWASPEASFLDVLRALEGRGVIEREVAALFHQLRREGNRAAHDFAGSRQHALDQLKNARSLAIWFHRTFGGSKAAKFKAGPFVPPPDPNTRLKEIEAELAKARAQALEHEAAATAAKQVLDLEAKRRAEAEKAAERAEAERSEWEKLAKTVEKESTAKLIDFEAALRDLQSEAKKAPEAKVSLQIETATAATNLVDLDEEQTRLLIDAQLREAGWEVDTRELRYSLGSRPQKGKMRAIAEWPTAKGIADYVLFVGKTAIGVVEAKRKAKSVSGSIEQAKRYSITLPADDEIDLACPPGAKDGFAGWAVGSGGKDKATFYKVPFLYATNGRPYLRQLETESGIWFLDARRPTNHARALTGWHTPDTLVDMLDSDEEAAQEALETESTDYLELRDYQLKAIEKVEAAIAKGQRELLVAMATGTGKTRMAIGLIYRLLKAKRFRRVLFLVDRSALGEQAQNAFKEMRLENMQTFAEIYEVKELGHITPDSDTKVHVATVQGMVKRILYPEGENTVPIDRYDCIIVDESHRGYTLDRDMTEGELEIRSFSEYVSTYRRVLDHFDAVKIGLTATPALHTKEIFGAPVYMYGYREAVVDGWLVDHEPPVRITTKLSKEGIHFKKGEKVPVLKSTGDVELSNLPDELNFEVDDFNNKVITEAFNKVVAAELVKYIDPTGDEKTLVFCANDRHADLFVKVLKEAFEATGAVFDDDAIKKLTGASDNPLELIRRYKNEKTPNVAVTVDLLTTGIDVPPICNLVFIRRVRSRILYEQMMGRATRRCDSIGKEVFHIYDAVDLYAGLEPFTSMKPLVKDPTFSMKQLLEELVSPKSHKTAGSEKHKSHADDVLEVVIERLRRASRGESKRKGDQAWAAAAEQLENVLGTPLKKAADKLKELGAKKVADLLAKNPGVVETLIRVARPKGTGPAAFISDKPDELVEVTHGYGKAKKPDDYLDAFKQFVKENMNLIPALAVVTQRPRSLTRAQLKELRLRLDGAGFNEAQLQTAWRDLKNEDIAATIIGFIRQQALGSPLVPYGDRVDRAYKRVTAKGEWTAQQKKWLERIATQLKKEVVVDKDAFERGAFKSNGGYRGVDKALGGKLDKVLDSFGDAIWDDSRAA